MQGSRGKKSVGRRARMFPKIQKVRRMKEMSSRLEKNVGSKRARRQEHVPRRSRRKLETPETLELIPGIPDELVSMQILPRLPWYQRPVMMAVSKLWRSAICETNGIRSRSREFLRNTSIVLLMRCAEFPTLEHFDVTVGTWQGLPPLPPRHENAGIRDIFTVDGDLYVVCDDKLGRMFRMEMSAGLWLWEAGSRTAINGAVELAYVSGGWLHLAGRRRPPCMVYERHSLVGDCLTRLNSFSDFFFDFFSVRVCNIKALLDKHMSKNLQERGLFLYRSDEQYGIYTLPVHVSETKFYIVRGRRYLEFHDMSKHEEWMVVCEVDLRRKLKMIGNEKVVALASGETCLYVGTLVFSRDEIGNFRLWRGCGVGDDPGQFEWKLLSSSDRPVESHWLWSLNDLKLKENFKGWDAIRLVAF